MPFMVQIPSDHVCDLPDKTKYGVGTIWRCDECGRTWELKEYHDTDKGWFLDLTSHKPTHKTHHDDDISKSEGV